jgi:hypothetical protein
MAMPLKRNPVPATATAASEAESARPLSPAANLLLAEIVLRGTSIVTRRLLEKNMLKAKFGPETAHQTLAEKSALTALAAIAISRIGTSSLPGALLVGGGLVAKALYDRSEKHRTRQAQIAARKQRPKRIP